MTRTTPISTAAILLALSLSGQGQDLPATRQLFGQVVDRNGAPIGDALVTLFRPGGSDRLVVDPRGRFVFRNLPAGSFNVMASRPGFLDGFSERPAELSDGQSRTDLTVRLMKGAAIGGTVLGATVLGATGEPVAGVEMLALRRSLIGGRWIFAPGPATTTDDLGRYRFSSLGAGDYAIVARPEQNPETALLLAMLSANPAQAADVLAAATAASRARPESDERMRTYATTFYPDASTASGATLIHAEPESERLETDFRLRPARTVRVSGMLSERVDGVTLQLFAVDARGVAATIDSAVTACDEEGAFEFTGVTPGRYVINVQATPPPPGGPQQPLPAQPVYSASLPIAVGTSGMTNVSVPIRKGAIMSGRVAFNGASAPPAPAQLIQITLRFDAVDRPAPQGPAVWRGQVGADERFTVSLPPGEYLVRADGLPRGWRLESAMSGGRDLLDVPAVVGATDINDLTIAFTDAPPAFVTGTIHGANGAATPDGWVMTFPVDRTLWRDSSPQARRLRRMRSASGRFSANLPPGEYFVVAVNGDVPNEWQDPELLSAWAAVATRVQIQAGPPIPVDVQVPPALKPRPQPTTTPSRKSSSVKATRPKVVAHQVPGNSVGGTVLDRLTRRPAGNATVLLAGTDVGLLRVTSSDDRGQFLFTGLPAGHFLIGAGKDAYLPAVFGASQPGRPGTPLALGVGQPAAGVTLSLVRGGVIAGHVTGDNGRPVPNARVRVVQRRAAGGEVAMTGDAGEPVTVMTDDRGAYRVFNLPPGDYAVLVQARGLAGGDIRRLTEADVDGTVVSPPAANAPGQPAQNNGMSMAWTATYAPSTASPSEALAVTLGAGEMRADVDVRTTLTRLVRVEGQVSSRDRVAMPNVQITLRPKHVAASGIIPTNLNTRPGPEGRFMFPNVPPGEYTILARTIAAPNAPPSAVLWANTDVVVHEGNLTDIALELQNSLSVSGELRMDNGARLPSDLPIVRVGVRPTPGSGLPNPPPPIDVPRNGRFTIEGLVPGRYRLFVQVPNDVVLQVPAWFAKTATPNGANAGDALDVPFELAADSQPEIAVTLTDSTQEIDGVVRDATGAPRRDCTVVVFSTDRAFWFQQSRRISTRQSGRDGRFVFGIAAGLPIGEYYVAAVPDGRPGEQLDVLLLEELAKTAERVRLNADETKTVDLKTRVGPGMPGPYFFFTFGGSSFVMLEPSTSAPWS